MFKSLIPWNKKESEHPIVSFREKMDNLFEDFFSNFQNMSFWPMPFEKSDFLPRIDVSESEKEIHVTAELPGMTDKDIEITLENNVLMVKGEKKQEEERKERNYYHVERRYGSFYRSIPIPAEVDTEKIDASFKNGVLNIVVPKKDAEKKATKIKIETK